MNENNIIIFGFGQIGKAVKHFAEKLGVTVHVVDLMAQSGVPNSHAIDINDGASIRALLFTLPSGSIVVNALPFYLNELLATECVHANMHYIDFTEDDVMAAKVQELYTGTMLTCVTKCGLAPGMINYLGLGLVHKIENPTDLMISVGALPRNVNFSHNHPEDTYGISWSVDGLVNEYIRPCQIKRNGRVAEIPPLSGIETVYADGRHYEAAFTSGGVGSLIKDLPYVKNIAYKTLRYPGHWAFMVQTVNKLKTFEKLRDEFTRIFPRIKDDVIVVYAEARGTSHGSPVRESFSEHYIGVDGLTAIQSTTAGGGVAIAEMIFKQQLKGIVNHKDINFTFFINTDTIKRAYKSL